MSGDEVISLAGRWAFALDRDDCGMAERWWERALPEQITLPGSLQAQGFGDEVTMDTAWTGTIFDRAWFTESEFARYREPGAVKIPFWLQPRRYYVGAAWYQREVEPPSEWAGRLVRLTLERTHWFTRVWLDGREIGTGESLSTPHEFALGKLPAGTHRLTIRVDNRLHIAVGENAHSVSDQTQGNWNGVVGRIELSVHKSAWLEDVRVFPRVAACSVTVCGVAGGDAVGCELRVGDVNVWASVVDGRFEGELALGADAALWDEFSPTLHRLDVALVAADGGRDTRTLDFGLREISVEGTEFRMNGRPLFLRGTLDCCVFPRTGYPPTDVESWRDILRTLRAHGLNHVRFHSWCPPEAAFVAGDELGVYFQVECGVWPNAVPVLGGNSPSGIGDGASVDVWVYAEAERILRAYGNHACFVLMASGNEPGGPHHAAFLGEWVRHFRVQDSRRLYCGAAGWPELTEDDYHISPEPRVHQWGDGLGCRFNGLPPATVVDYRESVAQRSVPMIAHEIGQWCAYPSLGDVAKFDGALRPEGYAIFRDSLAAHHLDGRLAEFVRASGRLQALCYKEEIEAALRTPGMGGFQLLGLQDFPGQGTAPVGVLDAYWESKGYVGAAEFTRFCGPTVVLARLAKRVFTTGETLETEIEIANFGARPLADARLWWRLLGEDGREFGEGSMEVGRLAISLRDVPAPAQCRLVVGIEGAEVENDWNVWIYPERVEDAADGVMIFEGWSEEVATALEAGARVLLLIPPEQVRGDVALGFSPIFWNTWCSGGQAPHTLGILCDPAHPALAAFPTEEHSDWQWWYLVSRAGAMILDALPPDLRPIVQVIDDWFTNRRLGLVFEARVGAGRVLVCSIDLRDSAGANPVARQLRNSLLRYMCGEKFEPAIEIDAMTLRDLSITP